MSKCPHKELIRLSEEDVPGGETLRLYLCSMCGKEIHKFKMEAYHVT